ncbi:MAG TPA: flagellar protein FlgN [Verrucomicrobiae bacterium]|nr:flagellar protein FlgN [Verrucomicrobiae bacterium]
MKELLSHLIESLREELKQYGEMLALLDQQQQFVMHRQTAALPDNVHHINTQAEVLAGARHEREQRQRNLAKSLELPENVTFKLLIPQLPADYRPLVDALVSENNELLVRVQQRARQNHLMLSHCVDLMSQLIHSIFPATKPVTYDGHGHTPANAVPAQSLYQAVG